MTAESKDHEKMDVLKMQMTVYMDVYKHHLELFLKVVTLYLVIVGGIFVYLFRQDINLMTRRLLPAVLALSSIVSCLGCLGTRSWIRQIEREVTRISNELGIRPFPFLGPERLTLIMLVLSSGVFVAGLLLSFFYKFLLIQ